MSAIHAKRTGILWPLFAALLLVTLHFAGLWAMDALSVMDGVLAPGAASVAHLLAAVAFLILRVFVLVVLPGALIGWMLDALLHRFFARPHTRGKTGRSRRRGQRSASRES